MRSRIQWLTTHSWAEKTEHHLPELVSKKYTAFLAANWPLPATGRTNTLNLLFDSTPSTRHRPRRHRDKTAIDQNLTTCASTRMTPTRRRPPPTGVPAVSDGLRRCSADRLPNAPPAAAIITVSCHYAAIKIRRHPPQHGHRADKLLVRKKGIEVEEAVEMRPHQDLRLHQPPFWPKRWKREPPAYLDASAAPCPDASIEKLDKLAYQRRGRAIIDKDDRYTWLTWTSTSPTPPTAGGAAH